MTPLTVTRSYASRAAARPLQVSDALGSAGRLAAWLAGWPVRYVRARRNLAELASLTDLQLRDIGLSRSDVIGATALPRDEDPTPQLAALVRERRRNRGSGLW